MKSSRAKLPPELNADTECGNPISGYSERAAADLLILKDDLDAALKGTSTGIINNQMVVCRAVLECLDRGFSDSTLLMRSILDVAALAALAKRSDAASTLPQSEFNRTIWFRNEFVESLDQIVLTGLNPSKAGIYKSYTEPLTVLFSGIREYL